MGVLNNKKTCLDDSEFNELKLLLSIVCIIYTKFFCHHYIIILLTMKQGKKKKKMRTPFSWIDNVIYLHFWHYAFNVSVWIIIIKRSF